MHSLAPFFPHPRNLYIDIFVFSVLCQNEYFQHHQCDLAFHDRVCNVRVVGNLPLYFISRGLYQHAVPQQIGTVDQRTWWHLSLGTHDGKSNHINRGGRTDREYWRTQHIERPAQRANNGTFTHCHELPKDTLNEQGVESQPGPVTDKRRNWLEKTFLPYPPENRSLDIDNHPECHLIESQNCASLMGHYSAAVARRVHCSLYQETCVEEKQIENTEGMFNSKGWGAIFTPACKEGCKPSAGVATALRKDGCITRIFPATHDYKKALATGRICIGI